MTTPPTPKKTKINSVIDEINRGKEYSRSLEQRQSLATKVKPTYELDKPIYPDVYVKKCIVPDYTPNFEECRHIKRSVINRDELDNEQHINLLAQPKFVRERQIEKPYTVKKKVLGPSCRIIQLARPNKRRALDTCRLHGATMEQFCIDNCHRNIEDITFVPVHDAVFFIKMKKRKPLIEKQRLKLRMQRLKEKINEAKMSSTHEIIQQLYASLKPFLLIPVEDAAKDDTVVRFSSVVKRKLTAMLDDAKESKDDKFLDTFLIQISEKLAFWMKALLNFNQIEPQLTIENEEAGTGSAAQGSVAVGATNTSGATNPNPPLTKNPNPSLTPTPRGP